MQLAQIADQATRVREQPKPQAAPTADDFIIRPEWAAQQVADARVAAAMTPMTGALDGLANQLAQNTRSLAVQRFADDFRRWGNEIDGHMAQVATDARTLDNYEKVITFVRGKHLDELATERAKALIATGGLGERSGGMSGVPGASGVGVDLNKLPSGLGEVAKRHGFTEQMVNDWCRANPGWTPERWMTEVQNGKVFTHVSPFTVEMRDDQLGIKRQFA